MLDSKTKKFFENLGIPFDGSSVLAKKSVFRFQKGSETHTCFSSIPLKGTTDPSPIGEEKNAFFFCGTNCIIALKENNLYLLSNNGYLCVQIGSRAVENRQKDNALFNEVFDTIPTFNGAMIRLKGIKEHGFQCVVTTNIPYVKIRKNDKNIALMKAPFSPYAVLSTLFVKTAEGNHFPLLVDAAERQPGKTELTFTHNGVCGDAFFEINMYESKLIQDTTVESFHPAQNNAFGSTAFLGTTREFGEQWLYSKMNLKAVKTDPASIKSANLIIPVFEGDTDQLEAIELSSRFCSFRSNWNNKLLFKTYKTANIEQACKSWISISLTEQIKNELYMGQDESSGFILRQKGEGAAPVLISTGDSFAFPQILEIVT